MSQRRAALAVPAAATALLLGACVPLDAPLPTAAPSAPTHAATEPAQDPAWGNCPNLTVSAGDPRDAGTHFVAVRQERRSPGMAETRDFVDDPFTASIHWDPTDPGSARVNDLVAETTGVPVAGSAGGFANVGVALSANTGNGTFVGYEAVTLQSVSFSAACGETLSAAGTVNTWKVNETGILDCELPHGSGVLGPVASEAKKLYCGD